VVLLPGSQSRCRAFLSAKDSGPGCVVLPEAFEKKERVMRSIAKKDSDDCVVI